MAVMKMDGTARTKRQLKRKTKELPFWIELAFVRGYQQGLARFNGVKAGEDYSDSPTTQAGYAVGRRGADKVEAFKELQAFAALHGFHRD